MSPLYAFGPLETYHIRLSSIIIILWNKKYLNVGDRSIYEEEERMVNFLKSLTGCTDN